MRLDKGYRAWLIASYAEAEATQEFHESRLDSESSKFHYVWNAAQASILRASVNEALGYGDEAAEVHREMQDAAEAKYPEVAAHWELREKVKGNA